MTSSAVGPVEDLVRRVRFGLEAVAEPSRSAPMQAYMKSTMPFLGVPRPLRAKVEREVLGACVLPDRAGWERAVRALWYGAAHREERYVAVTLTGWRPYRRWLDPAAVPLLEELVVDGAWWDYVDELSTRRLGPVLRAEPPVMAPVVRAWSRDEDRWKRRAAVICQVGAKDQVDIRLLEDCVVANLDDPDFFLRKGIGWALRDAARSRPGWVRTFVEVHRDRLSPLSRREALRHLG
ncbi:MAG TPA: DNA alkylation repair protein [Jiangellales bacterium]|nr:DNA alkylation repair protein [Jiangellales bacterium]